MPTSTEDSRLLLTPREAAEALRLSQRTLWALTNRGELRATRVGRCVRYSRASLEAFIERQTDANGADHSSQ